MRSRAAAPAGVRVGGGAPIAAGLVGANVAVWTVALLLFGGQPTLIAAAALAWGLGLRHALDPDHLAVIDNAVRVSVDAEAHGGASGLGPGLWFALGHSTVVVVACAGVAAASAGWRAESAPWREAGEVVGPIVSSSLLLTVALLNVVSVATLWRGRHAAGAASARAPGVLLGRLLGPLRRRLAASRSMYPVGVLMGLGFDTASEIALLALSAAEAARGLPFAAVLAFPALFAAGMAAVDAGNGWVMLRTYRWAAGDDRRRFACNLGVTAASAAVAIGIAVWQLWRASAR